MISSAQRPLPDNTTFTTDIHAPGGIRTHNLSRREAADLRLRPRGHWDRPILSLAGFISFVVKRLSVQLAIYPYLVTRLRNEWRCRSTFTTPSDFMLCTGITLSSSDHSNSWNKKSSYNCGYTFYVVAHLQFSWDPRRIHAWVTNDLVSKARVFFSAKKLNRHNFYLVSQSGLQTEGRK